jgi:hypothetical protein
MKRIITALIVGLWMLSACKGKSDHADFSVDTAQLKHMDSVRAAQRLADSVLMQRANTAPGINAGAGRYELEVPPGWRRVDTVLGNIKAVILDTASTFAGFRTIVSIVSDSLRARSIDGYLDGTVSSNAQYIPQFSLIGKGARVFGSRSARWLHYSQNRDGTQLESICYLLPDKGIVFILTCSALKGRLLASRHAFEEIVTSFAPEN